jgi:hypothetical protein
MEYTNTTTISMPRTTPTIIAVVLFVFTVTFTVNQFRWEYEF